MAHSNGIKENKEEFITVQEGLRETCKGWGNTSEIATIRRGIMTPGLKGQGEGVLMRMWKELEL